jgi:uncharacterized protein (DUF433 family)
MSGSICEKQYISPVNIGGGSKEKSFADGGIVSKIVTVGEYCYGKNHNMLFGSYRRGKVNAMSGITELHIEFYMILKGVGEDKMVHNLFTGRGNAHYAKPSGDDDIFSVMIDEEIYMSFEDRIERTNDILFGKPRIKGTRIAVDFILDLLSNGWTETEILSNYPNINSDNIRACVEYANATIRRCLVLNGLGFLPITRWE